MLQFSDGQPRWNLSEGMGIYEGFCFYENNNWRNMKLLREQVVYPKKSLFIFRSCMGWKLPAAFVIQHFDGGAIRTYFTPVELTNEA